jgi:hypothetical protein
MILYFEKLKKAYGSHSDAAKALGISKRAYLYYRTGEIPIPACKKLLILLAAEFNEAFEKARKRCPT